MIRASAHLMIAVALFVSADAAWSRSASHISDATSVVGRVVSVSEDFVMLQNGSETLKFKNNFAMAGVVVGQVLKVTYALDPIRVEVQAEQPGEAAPEPSPMPAPVIDDRAFYPA